jgi:ferredoxin-type protein NapH
VSKQPKKRQAIRKALVISSFLLFPITFKYFSPGIIITGAARGIINGSFMVFTFLFIIALFLGRAWCSWVCPGAGIEELAMTISAKPARGGKLDWIKWGIWVVWLGVIAWFAIAAGGYHAVDFFLLTDGGVSLSQVPLDYIIYYVVLGLFFILPLIAGKRATCHYFCWIAPFMILARKIGNLFKWPVLGLHVEPDNCIDCKRCSRECQMSLDVAHMVQAGKLEHSECILCGQCVDSCPKNVLRYTFSSTH